MLEANVCRTPTEITGNPFITFLYLTLFFHSNTSKLTLSHRVPSEDVCYLVLIGLQGKQNGNVFSY